MAASDEIMRAITGVGKNVAGINQRLQSFCTKTDFQNMTKEIRDGVERNANNIAKLTDQCAENQQQLNDKVERIVDKHVSRLISNIGGPELSVREAKHGDAYLKSRRSILVWPVTGDLKAGAVKFLLDTLQVPAQTVDEICIDSVERMRQARRAKVKEEIMVCFATAADRDAVQSYAANLATAGRDTGLRMHIPEHLRSLFKQFERHAIELKGKHPELKRSIKFDDTVQSLAMDVKLSYNSSWQRINEPEMKQLSKLHAERNSLENHAKAKGQAAKEKRAALMIDELPTDRTGGRSRREESSTE